MPSLLARAVYSGKGVLDDRTDIPENTSAARSDPICNRGLVSLVPSTDLWALNRRGRSLYRRLRLTAGRDSLSRPPI